MFLQLHRQRQLLAEQLGELRRTEAALREREEFLATTLDSIGDGVIATDVENRVVGMNPVAERLTGWRFAGARSRALGEVFSLVQEETGEPIENPAERVLREGAVAVQSSHAAIVARDGGRRPVAHSAAPICDAAGKVRGVVVVLRDVSDERRAQEALAKARLQVEFSARMAAVGTLAAGVGHEINNPLAYVIANLELLASQLPEIGSELSPGRLRDLPQVLNEALEGASRIRRIVRDLGNSPAPRASSWVPWT